MRQKKHIFLVSGVTKELRSCETPFFYLEDKHRVLKYLLTNCSIYLLFINVQFITLFSSLFVTKKKKRICDEFAFFYVFFSDEEILNEFSEHLR